MVITNTTTPENIEMLRQRGVRKVLTTTPRYEGRSFGINMMEAVLTAYSGARRQLSIAELNVLIDELQLRRLKKRKLMLKDQIARLESELIPDMNA